MLVLSSPPYSAQMSIIFGISKRKFSYKMSPNVPGVMKSSCINKKESLDDLI